MFAIAFDLDYWETQMRHPSSLRQAYRDIETTLARYGFSRVQQSTCHCATDDLMNLFAAVLALKAMPWFAECVRDIRGYRVEQWSDLTPLMKGTNL